MPDPDDAELLRQGVRGVGRPYDRHAGAVLRFARALLESATEADDVVQDTFLLVWRKRRSVTTVDGSALPWLLTAARYNALAARRRVRRRQTVPLELADGATSAGGDDLPVRLAIECLPAGERQVIEAVLVQGLSYAEAADRLGVPVTTVGKRLVWKGGLKQAAASGGRWDPDIDPNTSTLPVPPLAFCELRNGVTAGFPIEAPASTPADVCSRLGLRLLG